MNILLIGSGGREHALAWALADSPLTTRLVIAPGNPGLEPLGALRAGAADDLAGLVELAREIAADLVVIGPEVPLVMGLADRPKYLYREMKYIQWKYRYFYLSTNT